MVQEADLGSGTLHQLGNMHRNMSGHMVRNESIDMVLRTHKNS